MIAVVTGPMRSGTSFLARTLHELGVPMGSRMLFPVPGRAAEPDYEDSALTDLLLSGIRERSVCQETLQGYIEARSKSEATWGMKSPFLLPFLEPFCILARSQGHEVRVLLTERAPAAAEASLHAALGAHPEALRIALSIQATLWAFYSAAIPHATQVFPCEASRSHPAIARQRVAEVVGRG